MANQIYGVINANLFNISGFAFFEDQRIIVVMSSNLKQILINMCFGTYKWIFIESKDDFFTFITDADNLGYQIYCVITAY